MLLEIAGQHAEVHLLAGGQRAGGLHRARKEVGVQVAQLQDPETVEPRRQRFKGQLQTRQAYLVGVAQTAAVQAGHPQAQTEERRQLIEAQELAPEAAAPLLPAPRVGLHAQARLAPAFAAGFVGRAVPGRRRRAGCQGTVFHAGRSCRICA